MLGQERRALAVGISGPTGEFLNVGNVDAEDARAVIGQ